MISDPHFKLHADDEGVDRIEINVVPRFKTSGLSGDEWRVSARIRVYRKGELVGERSVGDMHGAAQMLPYLWLTLPEWTQGPLFAGERGGKCQQAGCAEPATTTYRLKQEYSAHGESPLPPSPLGAPCRRFCAIHATRGDCGLEDADENYELVSGEPAQRQAIPTDAVSPSAQVEITADTIEQVPEKVQAAVEAIRQARKREGN